LNPRAKTILIHEPKEQLESTGKYEKKLKFID